MSVYDVFAQQIQHFEGWYPGSRSYRNNNPGNIRPGSLNLGQSAIDSGGFAIFPSFDVGYNALINDIAAKFSGRTRTGLGPQSSVVQFFQVYAPSSDNNNPAQYAQSVVDGINANAGTSFTIYSTLGDIASVDTGVITDSGPVLIDDGSGNLIPDPSADDSSGSMMWLIVALLLAVVGKGGR